MAESAAPAAASPDDDTSREAETRPPGDDPVAGRDDPPGLSQSTKLPGLPGDNPLGFLAALGAQAALSVNGAGHRLSWTNEPIPRAVITPAVTYEAIADAAKAVADDWLAGSALDREIDPKLKLKPPEIREYLEQGRMAGTIGVLASCLLAEDSLDDNRNAKPTDFYFTAGNQEFVTIARTILGETRIDHIIDDLSGPWQYALHEQPLRSKTLMWDSTDDRQHAYSAADPTNSTANPKLTNPGAEALAVIGLSCYPCFAADRTLTQGCSGTWKSGSFTWPLWTVAATKRTVRSLLAQVTEPSGDDARRGDWYRAWGIGSVLQAQVHRSSQGGYGTFGPARVIWQRE